MFISSLRTIFDFEILFDDVKTINIFPRLKTSTHRLSKMVLKAIFSKAFRYRHQHFNTSTSASILLPSFSHPLSTNSTHQQPHHFILLSIVTFSFQSCYHCFNTSQDILQECLRLKLFVLWPFSASTFDPDESDKEQMV